MTLKEFSFRHRYRLILVLVSFILYGSTIKNEYGLDDEFVTTPGNISARGIKAIPKIFKSFHVKDESKNSYEYRPIVKVSFAIEHQFLGVNPHISHFINIVLYALCLMLLLNLLKQLFPAYPPFTLFCMVLVFAFIPVHSEVVVSLKNRDVLLSFIFTMGAFISALKFSDTRHWRYVLYFFLNIALAFLCKYDVLPYMLIIPLCLFIKDRKNLKFAGAMFMVAFLALLLTKFMKRTLPPSEEARRVFLYFENPMYFPHAFSANVSAALNSLGFYVKMILWPSHMSSYYGYNVVPVFSFTSLYAVTGVMAAAALAYFFFRKIKAPDLVWYGVLFFSASISMYLNFTKPAPGIVADRFMFFASIGFAILAVHFLFINQKSKKYPVEYKQVAAWQKLIAGIVLLCYTVVVLKRNGDWTNRMVLFETDSKNYPESVKLSLLCASQGIIELPRKDGAIPEKDKPVKIKYFEKILYNAIATDSTCSGCYNNLGYLLLTYEQDPARAKPFLVRGLRSDSLRKELVCNLGISYLRLGIADTAERLLLKAAQLDTNQTFMVPYEALQSLYMRTNVRKGIDFFSRKVQENPNSEFFNIVLAKTLFDSRDTVNGIMYYKRALRINPNNPDVSKFVDAVERYQHHRYP